MSEYSIMVECVCETYFDNIIQVEAENSEEAIDLAIAMVEEDSYLDRHNVDCSDITITGVRFLSKIDLKEEIKKRKIYTELNL